MADLKQGNISRHLVTLAAPLLVGSILQQLYNAADAVIVRHFAGEEAFAAAGIAGNVMNLFIFLIIGACTGVSIVMASLYGAGDEAGMRRESFLAAVFGTGCSVLLGGAAMLLMGTVLRLINTPDALMPFCRQYLTIIFLGMPANFFYNLGAAALRAIGDTSHSTVFLTIAITANVVLDLLLVGAFRLGMAGAAIATVASQALSAVLCIGYIAKKRSFLIFRRSDMQIDHALLKKTARFSLVSALNQSSLYIGKLLVQGSVNAIDPESIAPISGFTAGGKIEAFINAFGLAGGDAMSVFVAQNLGAGEKKRAREGFKKGMLLLTVVGFALSLLMFIPAELSVSLFVGNDSPDALAEGVHYLRWVAAFYTVCFIDCAFLGWNRGSGELRIFMSGTILQVVIRVVGSWLLAPVIGLTGVAVATGAGWTILAFYKAIAYHIMQKRAAVAGQESP